MGECKPKEILLDCRLRMVFGVSGYVANTCVGKHNDFISPLDHNTCYLTKILTYAFYIYTVFYYIKLYQFSPARKTLDFSLKSQQLALLNSVRPSQTVPKAPIKWQRRPFIFIFAKALSAEKTWTICYSFEIKNCHDKKAPLTSKNK